MMHSLIMMNLSEILKKNEYYTINYQSIRKEEAHFQC